LPYFKSLFKKEVRNSRGDKPVASLNTLQKYLGESKPVFTPFLRAAEARGAKWSTGMGMLVNQAAINIEMWTGKKPNKQVMYKALEAALD
jgi:hypothetical protein